MQTEKDMQKLGFFASAVLVALAAACSPADSIPQANAQAQASTVALGDGRPLPGARSGRRRRTRPRDTTDIGRPAMQPTYAKCHRGLEARALRHRPRRDPRARSSTSRRSSCPTGSPRSTARRSSAPRRSALFSQMQGRTYANMFGLVERFIGPKMLRDQPRPLARRPDRVRGAGALHRRGAQAPGDVPAHGAPERGRTCTPATASCRSRTTSPRGARQDRPGRCSR